MHVQGKIHYISMSYNVQKIHMRGQASTYEFLYISEHIWDAFENFQHGTLIAPVKFSTLSKPFMEFI